METYNIKDFKDGWFIGDFTPSVFKNCFFEIAHHKHPKDYIGQLHTHKHATELTYIIKGTLVASDKYLCAGDMFVYKPDEIAMVKFLEDTELIVLKWPSLPNDKIFIKNKIDAQVDFNPINK